MTQDEIIEMARQADPFGENGRLYVMSQLTPSTLEAFAKLVEEQATAKEREACAKVAERFEPDEKTSYVTYASTAIRARGQA
jgi:hypothetical protein